MKKNKTLMKSVIKRSEYKRKFSIRELYQSFVFLPGAIRKMLGNNKSGLVNKQFIERLQLSVTEVNGCAVCSYQHTKMALNQGMSNEEISSFLSGGDNFIKPEEAKAIMFAQHYADSRGLPEKNTFDSILKEYGKEKANIILSAIQIITVGNMYGIPFSAFLSRIKGNPYKNSTLFYELEMLIIGILCLPFAIIHGFLRVFFGFPNIRYGKNTSE